MTITNLLKAEVEATYGAAEKLIAMVQPGDLGWKPATGKNWMTVAQVMQHCTNACGSTVKGFVTGDWGLPEGMKFEDIPPEQMMPPAETMPAAESVAAALAALAKDKKLTLGLIAEAGEDRLNNERFAAPWGGPETTLGHHVAQMIGHLGQHKGQLYYYLKLMGRDVNTMHLWGM